MSKPNLLAFSTSVGFYRNRKVRDARAAIGKKISRKVDFRELTPILFSMLMAYAAENQIDGDFSGYTPEGFQEIFGVNHLQMSLAESKAVIDTFHDVGLMEEGKIRSWKKFNRHLANYEQDKKAKIKAGKERQRLRAEQNNGKAHHEYLGTPAEQAAASKAKLDGGKILWNGKAWFPSELQGVLKDLEQRRDALLKNKPSADTVTANSGTGAIRTISDWLHEINGLERKIAEIRGALTGEKFSPKVHKLPKAPEPEPPLPSEVVEKGKKQAAHLLKELASSI